MRNPNRHNPEPGHRIASLARTALRRACSTLRIARVHLDGRYGVDGRALYQAAQLYLAKAQAFEEALWALDGSHAPSYSLCQHLTAVTRAIQATGKGVRA